MPTRPSISWTDLVGHRVGLWGLGVEGRASLRKLRSLGLEPVIVDDRPDPGEPGPVLATAAGGLDALARCDIVIKTPGISRYRPEVAHLAGAGTMVVGGLGLWLQGADRNRVLCITGTKGKSTTTSIAAHLARGLGLRVFAGGNLGSPPYDPDAPADVDLWVIEVSSYQATDMAVSPPVVAVTSLSPDHLPWHEGLGHYIVDKLSLCTQPGARLTVASSASPLLVDHAGLLGPKVRWVSGDTWPPAWAEPMRLLGHHNYVNASVARACLEALGIDGADDEDRLRAAGAGFTPLEGRLELVATVDGVDFIDDGLSTNVLPTLAAVAAFADRPVALIAGGLDRQIDYIPLAQGLAGRAHPTLVLTTYQTGPAIQRAIDDHPADGVTAVPCADLAEAVARAFQWARPDGGAVLLSPAAASFDAFADYKAKGRAFRAAIAGLDAGPPVDAVRP